MGALQVLGIVVLIIGMVLIGIEFYIPGFGVPGISGIVCTIVGVFLVGRNAQERILAGAVSIVVIAVMLVISVIIFNSKKVKSPIKLDDELPGKNLFIEGEDPDSYVGKEGIAITDLKPSGKGEFDGERYDVLSQGNFIEKGAKLKITEVKNNKIFVEEGK